MIFRIDSLKNIEIIKPTVDTTLLINSNVKVRNIAAIRDSKDFYFVIEKDPEFVTGFSDKYLYRYYDDSTLYKNIILPVNFNGVDIVFTQSSDNIGDTLFIGLTDTNIQKKYIYKSYDG